MATHTEWKSSKLVSRKTHPSRSLGVAGAVISLLKRIESDYVLYSRDSHAYTIVANRAMRPHVADV